jgi:hypothetical protein
VIDLVDNRPLVLIYCETVPQEEGKEDEDPELAAEPVVAAACKIGYGTLQEAGKTELYMAKIMDLAMGAVTDLQVVDHQGVAYALIVYALPPEEGEDGDEDEQDDDSKPVLEPVVEPIAEPAGD